MNTLPSELECIIVEYVEHPLNLISLSTSCNDVVNSRMIESVNKIKTFWKRHRHIPEDIETICSLFREYLTYNEPCYFLSFPESVSRQYIKFLGGNPKDCQIATLPPLESRRLVDVREWMIRTNFDINVYHFVGW
jgi:predicted secreted protein